MNRFKSLAGFVLSSSPAEPANPAARGPRRPTSLNINPSKDTPAPAPHSELAAQTQDDHADNDDNDEMDAANLSRGDSAAGEANDRGRDGGNDSADVGDLHEEEEDQVENQEEPEDRDGGKEKKTKTRQKRRRRGNASSSDAAAGSDDDEDWSHNNAGSEQEDDDDGTRAKRLRRNAPRKSKDSATASKSTRSMTRRPRNKATTATNKKKATKVSKRRKGVAADGDEEVDELEEEDGAAEEEEEEEEGDAMDQSAGSSSEDELVQLTEADIVDLENPELVSQFTKLRNGDVDRGPIGVGDVVKLRPSGDSDSWLAVVERISVKTAELKPGEGDNRTESNYVGIQLSWLYARTDFENVHPSNPAWKGPCKVMGPNERVKTDHTDWNHQSMVLSKASTSLTMPIPVSQQTIPNLPNNPLSLFSIDALHPIAPSIYSWPALEALSRRSRTIAPITAQRKIPSYFFGVSALPTIDTLLPEEETSGKPKKLDGGKDGVAGIPYVRVGFAFKPLPKIPNGDIGNEEEEEGGGGGGGEGEATPRKGSPKKKKGRNGRRKSTTAKNSARKVWPLKFAQYSTSERPYNPRHVQHYSRAVGTWYAVSDLSQLLHSEHEHEHKVTREKPDELSSQPAFSLDLDAPTFDPHVARITTLIEKLGHLADDKIVRGGAYGLTGNAYLVIQAGELYERLTDSDSSPPMEYDADDVDAARALLADAVAWREEVARRVRGVQEGHKLAKEWRSVGDEDLPHGHEWLCPESGEST